MIEMKFFGRAFFGYKPVNTDAFLAAVFLVETSDSHQKRMRSQAIITLGHYI